MGAGESTLEQFTSALETKDLTDRLEGIDETGTLKPSAGAELINLDAEAIVEQLPEVSYESEGNQLPEVDIQTTIGKGGMAYVLAGNQVPLNREVAVKRLRGDLDKSENILALLQEAWVTGKLEHPNVIPIYRLGRDEDGNPVIVMKRVEGVVWKRLIDDPSLAPDHFDKGDPLDWHLDILGQVCNALHYAHHRGIIHRDLKPENIMVGEFGEVYVLDWGLAISLEPDRYNRIPSVEDVSEPAGTPAYMAPEMLDAENEKLDERTDVYLLGGLLHYVITGRPPHDGDSPFEVMFDAYREEDRRFPGHINREIGRICNRALSSDPEERFGSAEEFRQAIAGYRNHRQSLRLSAEAKMRLQSFRRMLDDEQRADDADIRAVFGECRFGFEQALEVSSKNDEARDGLQTVLELMIEYELDREAHESASMLLADLPEENSALEERMQRLRQAERTLEREFEELKELQSEFNIDLGRHTRSLLALAFGAFWAIAVTVPAGLEAWLGMELGSGFYAIRQGVSCAVILGGLYYGREAILRNEANRKLAGGLVMIFFVEVLVGFLELQAGVSMETLTVRQMAMTSLGAGLLAITLDLRIFWAAVPYLLGTMTLVYVPFEAPYVTGVTNLVAMGLLAWAWWPNSPDEAEGAASD